MNNLLNKMDVKFFEDNFKDNIDDLTELGIYVEGFMVELCMKSTTVEVLVTSDLLISTIEDLKNELISNIKYEDNNNELLDEYNKKIKELNKIELSVFNNNYKYFSTNLKKDYRKDLTDLFYDSKYNFTDLEKILMFDYAKEVLKDMREYDIEIWKSNGSIDMEEIEQYLNLK